MDPRRYALGDIDLAHDLVPKEPDPDKRIALEKKRRKELSSDKRFKSTFERLASPQIEVQLYLRQGKGGRRNPHLSFHDLDDFVLKESRSRIIFTKTQGILLAGR